jgi:uncharacterized membrane protein YjfL (UPF0719 family)
MEVLINAKYVTAAIVYSMLGILILATAFIVFDKLTPGNLWKEVVEKQNIALALIAAAMMLAMSNIIAAAIKG